MSETFYSIRMRAAERSIERGEKHISGGERIGRQAQIEPIVTELLRKGSSHSRGDADFLQIVIEKIIDEEIQIIPPLAVTGIETSSILKGRQEARNILEAIGISEQAMDAAFDLISSSNNLRGAALIHYRSGIRLDDRGERGVRVSRMDWQKEPELGARVREAIALASKVAHSPYTVAELCWSDDPEYVIGYVSNLATGYVRITPLKEEGCESGGRVFFVADEVDLDAYIHYLEKTPVLIRRKDE